MGPHSHTLPILLKFQNVSNIHGSGIGNDHQKLSKIIESRWNIHKKAPLIGGFHMFQPIPKNNRN